MGTNYLPGIRLGSPADDLLVMSRLHYVMAKTRGMKAPNSTTGGAVSW